MGQNRRKHFFINKPLQTRFMLAVVVPLFLINLVAIAGLYFGIWSKVLETFSDEQTLNDLVTASRMVEYDQARHPASAGQGFSSLSFFKQTEKLGQRQREVFREILNETNQSCKFNDLTKCVVNEINKNCDYVKPIHYDFD